VGAGGGGSGGGGGGAVTALAGAFADGAISTMGAKADAANAATDTTPVTEMSVLKEISAKEQAPASRAVTGTFWQTTQPVSGASGQFVDCWNATEGCKSDAVWTSGNGSIIALLKSLNANAAAATPAGPNGIGTINSQYPTGATAQSISTTGTTAATTATMGGAVNNYTFLCGFSIRANATAAATGGGAYNVFAHNTLQYTYATQIAFYTNALHDSKITNNLVQYVAGAGIGLTEAGGANNFSQNMLIDSNIVHDANNYPSPDSGCIYVEDKYHVSNSVGITNNLIYNCYGKGIYLDDNASFDLVQNNINYGDQIYCMMLHGGDHDIIVNNICDVTNLANNNGYHATTFTYQDEASCCSIANFGMAANVVERNIVYSGNNSQPVQTWTTEDASPTAPPFVFNNIYYAAAGTAFTNPDMYNRPSTFVVTDITPFFGNPQFANAAAHDYSFTGTYAAGTIGFVPINTTGWGP
jgi:hypothetical protein